MLSFPYFSWSLAQKMNGTRGWCGSTDDQKTPNSWPKINSIRPARSQWRYVTGINRLYLLIVIYDMLIAKRSFSIFIAITCEYLSEREGKCAKNFNRFRLSEYDSTANYSLWYTVRRMRIDGQSYVCHSYYEFLSLILQNMKIIAKPLICIYLYLLQD